MKQMRQFLTTLVVVWTAACITAYFYSQQQHIPAAIAWAVIPAFLVELAFYLVPGFPAARKTFDHLGSKPLRAAVLTGSSCLSYLAESISTGTFHISSLFLLLGLAAVASFWYAWLPARLPFDMLFLAYMAAVYLSKPFDQIYLQPAPHVPLEILGRLMWVRLGLLAVLSLRTMKDAQFGFLPSAGEWRIGAQLYIYFLPVGLAVGYLVNFARFRPQPFGWKFGLILIGTFLAFLWVVALAEEFFFRAFLQQSLARELRSDMIALLIASTVFGLAHLPFGTFPNWRFALIAGITGVFYGWAFLKAHSMRASMVTHALVVTTWRMFFVS